MINPLLLTDVYKMGHMEQYPEGTTKIYSYLHTRSDKKYDEIIVYGLHHLLKKYFTNPITKDLALEFLEYYEIILGRKPPEDIITKMLSLAELGYLPLEIKSFPEGTVLAAESVIATVTNTLPDFFWVVGFFESLLLHTWYPITVASASRKYWKLVNKYAKLTCVNDDHIPFAVHDFGYRGCTSEESAAIAGSAHLIHFYGTDTLPALHLIKNTYTNTDGLIGASCPASEHSVMCSFGEKDEIKAFEHMLDLYPTGIVSIVSDSYNLWNVLTNFAPKLKERILAREGKVVFRPDSGKPVDILCGTPCQKPEKPSELGVFELLGEVFGYTLNDKGYKILNPKVGVCYGDGMTLDNFHEILDTMMLYGWASSNLVIGVGGLLLQSHSRDDLGFSFKATYAEIKGEPVEIFKDPVTDHKKRSLTGLIKVSFDHWNQAIIKDHQSWEEESSSALTTVFKDGKLYQEIDWKSLTTKARQRKFND